MFKIGITGHRLMRIRGKEERIKNWLETQLKNLKSCNDKICLIDGMAQGVDQMAAFIALANGIELKCYFAYKPLFTHETVEYLKENAGQVKYISDKFQNQCYLKRDRRIVDDCDLLLVVWDGIEQGGTYYTYQYALEKGRDVLIFPWNE